MKAGTKTAKASPARRPVAKRAKTGAAKRAPARPPVPESRSSRRHVRDLMTRELVCASTGDSLRDVARQLDEYEISGLPVVDDQDRLVGVISRTDLLRRLLEGPAEARRDEAWLDLLTAGSARSIDVDAARLGTVDDLMSIDPVTAKADENLATVARRMADERVHRVVVIDDQRHPIGIVTTLDLLHVFPR